MEDHQFHEICHKLDKMIRLLEKLQPPALVFDDRPQQIVSVPGHIPDPNWATPTGVGADVNTTAIKSG